MSSIHYFRVKYAFVELFLAHEVGEVSIPEVPVTHGPPSTVKGLCRVGEAGVCNLACRTPLSSVRIL